MRPRLQTLAALVAVLLATGCATTSNSAAGPQAQCVVCKHNADLACVDLTVTDDTPKAEYDGKTYYFCSDECRDEFMKNPAKYVAR